MALAHTTAFALGVRPLLDEIALLARRARLSLTERHSVTRRDLVTEGAVSPRELDVLRLMADGSTNRQMANTLFISEKTAIAHVSRVLGKLGATNRTEAVTIARRAGTPLGSRVRPNRQSGSAESGRCSGGAV